MEEHVFSDEEEQVASALLHEFAGHHGKGGPKPVPLPRLRDRYRRCYVCCGARMPFQVRTKENKPSVSLLFLFLVVFVLFLSSRRVK